MGTVFGRIPTRKIKPYNACFEVSRVVPSPQEEVATGEVPPLFLVRGPSPPPLRTLQALLRASEAQVSRGRRDR